MFIRAHGPWNRTKKYADISVPGRRQGRCADRDFMTASSRTTAILVVPVDFLVLKDGSMLVSDDHAGAIYRISYGSVTRWAAGLLLGVAAGALALMVVSPRSRAASAPKARLLEVAPGELPSFPRRRPPRPGDVVRARGDGRPRSRDALRAALRRRVRGLSWRQRSHGDAAHTGAGRPALPVRDHAAVPVRRAGAATKP